MGLKYLGQSFQAPDGTAGAPAFAFDGDPDTGMYHTGTQLALSYGGVARLALSGGSVQVLGVPLVAANMQADSQVVAGGGVGGPGHSFPLDLDTGMYWAGPDEIGFAAGGAQRASLSSLGLGVTGRLDLTPVNGDDANPVLLRAKQKAWTPDIGLDTTSEFRFERSSSVNDYGFLSGSHGSMSLGFAVGGVRSALFSVNTARAAAPLGMQVGSDPNAFLGVLDVVQANTTGPGLVVRSSSVAGHLWAGTSSVVLDAVLPTMSGASNLLLRSGGSNRITLHDVGGITMHHATTFSAGLTAPDAATGVINIATAHGYDIYAEDTGAGSANNRLWVAGPHGGEMVFGPRSGASILNQIRLRGHARAEEGMTVTGTLTLQKTTPNSAERSSFSVSAGSSTVVGAGIYDWVSTAALVPGINVGGTWRESSTASHGSFITDGTNFRLRNSTAGAITVYYMRF